MKKVTIAYRGIDSPIISFAVPAKNIHEFLTDSRLFGNDVEFIRSWLSANGINLVNVAPSENGIIVIDAISKKIFDSQKEAGIGKITLYELTSNSSDNEMQRSAFDSFLRLVKSGRLLGFEEWTDSGTKLKTNILGLTAEEILAKKDELKLSCYGQFKFSTREFIVEEFGDRSLRQQNALMAALKFHGIISKDDIPVWNDYLIKLAKV